MEKITSRKNPYIVHLRQLAASSEYREEQKEYICDSLKLLKEAVQFGVKVTSVLWRGLPDSAEGFPSLSGETKQYAAPEDLFDYASPMKNSPGPLFTCAFPENSKKTEIRNAVILENVQDPGNVGTVIRTANAFGISEVILTGACADLYSPKTVRATMGAIFRQKIEKMSREDLAAFLEETGLPLYGAVLSDRAVSLRDIDITRAAVAVGSEGRGLSREFIEMCAGEIIIPMQPGSESLNAAMAGTVLMWEMSKQN